MLLLILLASIVCGHRPQSRIFSLEAKLPHAPLCRGLPEEELSFLSFQLTHLYFANQFSALPPL